MDLGVRDLLVLIAMLLALGHEWQAQGKALIGWAVVLLCLATVWGRLP